MQHYPDAPIPGPNTLCGVTPDNGSPAEVGSKASMAVDPNGDLFVPDFLNNRVLFYENPFVYGTSPKTYGARTTS